MPAGYDEPRKRVFHARLSVHETCGMKRLQELPEDSQFSPRKESQPALMFKTDLQLEQ